MKYLFIAIFLVGCSPDMTTQEVVDKLDECKKAGLHADVYRIFGDGAVMKIQCVPETMK